MKEQGGQVEMKKGEKVLDKLYVIDFDRTLVDSTRLSTLLLDAVDMLDVDSLPFRERLEQETGKSFQLLSAVKEVVGAEREDELKELFLGLSEVARTKKYTEGGFFEPGARYLLGALPRNERMIFTYGEDETWQTWKLEAAGLTDQNYMITTEKDDNNTPIPKPDLLAHMKQLDGTFVMKSRVDNSFIAARSLVMVDDKPQNLKNLPDGVTGFLYYPERAKTEQSPEKQQEYNDFLENNPSVQRLNKLHALLGSTALQKH